MVGLLFMMINKVVPRLGGNKVFGLATAKTSLQYLQATSLCMRQEKLLIATATSLA